MGVCMPMQLLYVIIAILLGPTLVSKQQGDMWKLYTQAYSIMYPKSS